eukprot:750448-Hanusia_phi.AAC.4
MEQHQQRGAKEGIGSCRRCLRVDFSCDLHLPLLENNPPRWHDLSAFRPVVEHRICVDLQHMDAEWL